MSVLRARLWATGVATALAVCGAAAEDKPSPAFPGAEDWGGQTPGGRGGKAGGSP